jgi:hypothetical protein
MLPHSPVLQDLETKLGAPWNQILVWVSRAQRHYQLALPNALSPLLHAREKKEKAQWVWYDKSPLAKPSSKEVAEIMTGSTGTVYLRKVPLGFPPKQLTLSTCSNPALRLQQRSHRLPGFSHWSIWNCVAPRALLQLLNSTAVVWGQPETAC